MKNVNVFSAAFILLSFSFVFTSCKRDTTDFVSATEQILIRSAWSVDYYYNNQDMTNSFSSSRILFSSTGAVGYQKDGQTIPGKWSINTDVTNNEMITLQFNTSDANVSMLNKSWKLTHRSTSSMQFVETDGTANIFFRIKTQ
ncbi:MAG TPA: hypothetical protein VGQ09_14200 [Chitinophagaceae bacterium]|jgi:hypothetical protein|nr:hypothetical protein [Chitinophagaceae bacterium]